MHQEEPRMIPQLEVKRPFGGALIAGSRYTCCPMFDQIESNRIEI